MSSSKQCPEIPFFGASYPDARCISGQLYDLDKCDENGNLYEMTEYVPCPFCNTEAFMGFATDSDSKEDVELWENQIKEWREKYGR